MVANERKLLYKSNSSTFRLIVGFKDQVNAFSLNAFPITKLRDAADFQQTETSYSIINFQLVVDLMNCEGAVSEGAHAAPITFRDGSSKFIVVSKSRAHSTTHKEVSFKLIVAVGHHEFTELNGLVVHHELIELIKGFIGHIELINGCVGHNKLTELISLVLVGHINDS